MEINIDIDNFKNEAPYFEEELSLLKKGLEVDFDWYPYSIMSNLYLFGELLKGKNRNFFANLKKGTTFIDIGAADGDLSFYWEKRGLQGTILDYPQTNCNNLKGAYALKDALNSKVRIITQNIDDQFKLKEQYDIAFALGILYHLKNPMHFLHEIALHSKYMFLSTKIAKYLPDGKTNIQDDAVAYLLDPREINNDATNFWVFSRKGLKRTLYRSGWKILNFKTIGAIDNSTPHEADRDERALVFARRHNDFLNDLSNHHDY